MFEIANQLLVCHSFYLVSWMNGNALSFLNVNWVRFCLSARCVKNNSRLVGNKEFLFLYSKQLGISLVSCAHSWGIELNTQREIPYPHLLMYYLINEVIVFLTYTESQEEENWQEVTQWFRNRHCTTSRNCQCWRPSCAWSRNESRNSWWSCCQTQGPWILLIT